MKLFHFYRVEDHSGVSGTGPVVEGVQFTNGWCALRWISNKSSICFYQSIDDVKSIHGHGGKTEIIIHDFEGLEKKTTPTTDAQFEVFVRIIEETSRLMGLASEPDASLEEIRTAFQSVRTQLDGLELRILKGSR